MKTVSGCFAAVLTAAALTHPLRAQETKGKFRFSFHGDYYSVSDKIRSNATNGAVSEDPQGNLIFLADPRNDRADERAATILDGGGYGIAVDYGLMGWKWGELELEANYERFESQINDLEVSYRVIFQAPNALGDPTTFTFPDCARAPISPSGRICPYTTYRTDVGKISWHNPQIGAKIRFRPTKQFAPFVGAGIGYYLVDFQRSAAIDILSDNLQASAGAYEIYDPKTFQISTVERSNGFGPIQVEAKDAFEYHFTGGIEYSFRKPRLTLFFETRYFFSDGKVRITTDGREEFGQSLPETRDVLPVGFTDLGFPIHFTVGGLMDVTSAHPNPNNPTRLKHGPADGILDAGFGYIQGGTIKYGGYDFSFGLRYSF